MERACVHRSRLLSGWRPTSSSRWSVQPMGSWPIPPRGPSWSWTSCRPGLTGSGCFLVLIDPLLYSAPLLQYQCMWNFVDIVMPFLGPGRASGCGCAGTLPSSNTPRQTEGTLTAGRAIAAMGHQTTTTPTSSTPHSGSAEDSCWQAPLLERILILLLFFVHG